MIDYLDQAELLDALYASPAAVFNSPYFRFEGIEANYFGTPHKEAVILTGTLRKKNKPHWAVGDDFDAPRPVTFFFRDVAGSLETEFCYGKVDPSEGPIGQGFIVNTPGNFKTLGEFTEAVQSRTLRFVLNTFVDKR